MGTVAELTAHLTEWARRPFRPGTADCAIFAADWVMRRGRPDPMAGLRGAYRRIEDGMALLAERGGAGELEELFADLAPVPGWMAARPGDVALVRDGDTLCCGIVGGEHVHVLAPGRGLDIVPLDRAERLWRP